MWKGRLKSKLELRVGIGSTAETLMALSTTYMLVGCLIPKLIRQDNLTRHGDLVTKRCGYDRYDARMQLCIEASKFTIDTYIGSTRLGSCHV